MMSSQCPNGYVSDGEGYCISENVSDSCATGYESDGFGNCVQVIPQANMIQLNEDIKLKSASCLSGYGSDGKGNCVPIGVPYCPTGYTFNASGMCVVSASV